MTLIATIATSMMVVVDAKIGYNQQCKIDSECRLEDEENDDDKKDLKDVCCAQLIYEANGVEIKKRECLIRTEVADAGGAYKFDGVTTTEAYCDNALQQALT